MPGHSRKCHECGSEMILLFRFWHCGAKCSELDSQAKAQLRRRNAGYSVVDLGWELGDIINRKP